MRVPGAVIVKFSQVFYVIDPEFRVLWVGGDWDEFALAYGGRDLWAMQVLGIDMQPCIAGPETLSVLRRIADAVRQTGRPFRMEHRGDSPDQRRDVRMTITPLSQRRLLVTYDLRDAQSFPSLGPGWSWQAGAPAVKCSFCCGLRQPDGAWADPFVQGPPHPPIVDYVVCPDCQSQVDIEIARLHKAGRLT